MGTAGCERRCRSANTTALQADLAKTGAGGSAATFWPWVHALRDQAKTPVTQPVSLPVEILPHLLLGDKVSARNIGLLLAMGVTHVLNVAGREADNKDIDYAACHIGHLNLDGEDEEGYPMLEAHFADAHAFIDKV